MTSVPDSEPKSHSPSAEQSLLLPTRARQKVFAPLDAARGLAALAVVAFHMRLSDSFQESLPTIYAIAKHGYLGVPLFFVISGFCLAASAASSRRNNESALSFLKRRFRRIYPPLWCSILVVAALP
jgi:peptidoglycan/LPS O-acetylase OafA/YrhL